MHRRRAPLAALLFVAGLCLPAPAQAHNGDVATFVLLPMAVEADGVKARGWVLQVHVARHALDAVVGLPSEADDPKGWRERAVAYVKAHVRFDHGGQRLALGSGGIRVGGHQTDLRFLLPGLPPAGGALKVRIDAFAEDGHQSNVVKLRGAEAKTTVLTADDDFSADITLRR